MLNGEYVLKVLFDSIKRRLDFSKFLQDLKEIDNNIKLTYNFVKLLHYYIKLYII
jgi:hypothetical protein